MTKRFAIKGNLVVLGAGSIGTGVLPLVKRYCDIPADRIFVVDRFDHSKRIRDQFGVEFVKKQITTENYVEFLSHLLSPKGSFLLNVSTELGTSDLIRLCSRNNSLYLDTAIDVWPGMMIGQHLEDWEKTNHHMRENILKVRPEIGNSITALINMGANPGLVNLFVKAGLVQVAKDEGRFSKKPTTQQGWAKLAMDLGVRGIQISECDHQKAKVKKRHGQFVNTWSVDAFLNECLQPGEMGWGTAEKWFPPNAQFHEHGPKTGIYFDDTCLLMKVRGWTPSREEYHGFFVNHPENITISDYLTYKENNKPVYRPCTYFNYLPSEDTILSVHELIGKGMMYPDKLPTEKKVLAEAEIAEGGDELGVLIYGIKRRCYWYGSHLSIEDARKRTTHQNPTGLQVTANVVSGMKWVVENPKMGILESDEVDYEPILEFSKELISPIVGTYSDWMPLSNMSPLVKEEFDTSDPWSFKNILVKS